MVSKTRHSKWVAAIIAGSSVVVQAMAVSPTLRFRQNGDMLPGGADVSFAFYVNDREQSQSSCVFSVLVGGKAVAPISIRGNHRRYSGQSNKQDLLIRCGDHLTWSPASYDIFRNDATIVFQAFTRTHLLDKELAWPGMVPFDDHYATFVGHHSGRETLREKWEELPLLVRRSVRTAYVLYVGVDRVNGTTTWFR
jgi:hypothetical protein